MDFNKTKFTKLESKKGIFLQAGFIITLAAVLLAFEWKSSSDQISNWDNSGYIVNPYEEEVIITRPKKPEPPPKPKSQQITQVDDKEKVENEFKADSEVSQKDIILPYIPEPPKKEKEIEKIENVPFTIVEEMPSFPGGDGQMMKYFAATINYPSLAKETNTQGIVFLTFVVEKDGSITNVSILRGIGAGCDEEAIRVVRSMPRWNPGKQLKNPVRVKMNLPINFKLMD